MKRMLTEAMIAGLLAIVAANAGAADQPYANNYDDYLSGYKHGASVYTTKATCPEQDDLKSADFNMGVKDGCSTTKRRIRKSLRLRAKLDALK